MCECVCVCVCVCVCSNTYPTDIYFINGTTRGLDPGYDSGAFGGSAAGLYTNLVENNTGLELAIQSLPHNDLNDVVVPLGVKADQGTQISIGVDADSTLPANINVYLEDNLSNTWTLLNANDYVLTPTENLSDTGRFFVHFTEGTLSTNDNTLNGIQIYAQNEIKSVVVKGQLSNNTTASIFDLQGRQILQNVLDNSTTTNTIDVSVLSSGIYIVKLNNQNQNKTQKIIIK